MGALPSEQPDYLSHPPAIPIPWRQTPLIESSYLSRLAGCRVLLKLENLQPSGSFKSRGIGNLIWSTIIESQQSQLSCPTGPDTGTGTATGTGTPAKLHFYSSSGGNAGMAAVTAARDLGYPCSVVVPRSTDEAMVAKLKRAGATEVIVHGDSWFNADQHLRQDILPHAKKVLGVEGVYVPPFNDERIWDGAATMVEEIKEQLATTITNTSSTGLGPTPPKGIICSVGGGGLLCGIIRGLERVGWDGAVKVAAVETQGADSLAASVQKGQLTTLSAITSVAKTLGAVQVAETAFKYASDPRLGVRSVVLSDAAACTACVRFADDERILVEPACGVSLALVYDAKRLRSAFPDLTPDDTVIVIVCGGSGVSVEKLETWKREYGII